MTMKFWDFQHRLYFDESPVVYPYQASHVLASSAHFFVVTTDGFVRVLRASPPYSLCYRLRTAGRGVLAASYIAVSHTLAILERVRSGESHQTRQVNLYALPRKATDPAPLALRANIVSIKLAEPVTCVDTCGATGSSSSRVCRISSRSM